MYDDRIVNQIDNLLYFRFISKVCMWGGQKVRDYLQPLKKKTQVRNNYNYTRVNCDKKKLVLRRVCVCIK